MVRRDRLESRAGSDQRPAQSQLHQIVSGACPLGITTGFFNEHPYFLTFENAAGKIPVIASYDFDHLRIDLDHVDTSRAVVHRLKHRGAAAETDHQNLGGAGKLIG